MKIRHIRGAEADNLERTIEYLKNLKEDVHLSVEDEYSMTITVDSKDLKHIQEALEDIKTVQKQIEYYEDKVRIYNVVDEFVKEQSRKIKHLFPLENIVGYGQLCDKVLELERKVGELSEDICPDCGKRDSWCVCFD